MKHSPAHKMAVEAEASKKEVLEVAVAAAIVKLEMAADTTVEEAEGIIKTINHFF
jgi:hypothetical protein